MLLCCGCSITTPVEQQLESSDSLRGSQAFDPFANMVIDGVLICTDRCLSGIVGVENTVRKGKCTGLIVTTGDGSF
jgi:hypothetical protein